MIECENVMTIISRYLRSNDKVTFSSINKMAYYSKLNPISNPMLNSSYRSDVLNKFYFSEFLDEVDTHNKEEVLDDYNITKNNWKQIYLELMQHYYNYNYVDKRKYVTRVFELFKNHIYLPFVRKSNYILENKDSTLHQLYFYDFSRTNLIIYNHYDKYLDLNNNGFIGQEQDNFIIRKKQALETDLLNFNELTRNVLNNNNYITIIEKIVNYDYKGVDDLYNENNMIGVNNSVMDFILWLNHSAILFSRLLYAQMIIYCDNKNGNELIIQFVKNHENFVNFSLSINEQFNNLNVIINYLYRFINDKTKKYCGFSLYKLFFNIMKKEIYDKLMTHLELKFKILVDLYCKELFAIDNNERKLSFESRTKQDSNDSDEENDDFEMNECDLSLNEENKELTKKDIIDNFMKCVTDLSIDEKNALCINHSNLKMNENYIKYENILINSFVKEIDNCLTKEKFLVDQIFEIVKSLFSIRIECSKRINSLNDNSFKFIRRTKKILIKNIEQCLLKNITKNIKEEFCEYVKNNNNNQEENTKNKKISNDINKNMKELIDELDKEEKEKMDNYCEDMINYIKNELLEIISKDKNICNIINIVEILDNYLKNVALDITTILKEIIFICYFEKKLYIQFDNKIINTLNSYNNNSLIS